MATKYRVILADDEAPARKKMVRLLGEFEELDIALVAENGLEAYEAILKEEPDIVFLDIEMPGMSGLEVVEQLPDEKMPHVVFATAYNEHAIKAFELKAIDYLLKPFNQERLEQTMEKIFEMLEDEEQEAESRKNTKASAAELSEILAPTNLKKIPIPTADRFKLINYDEVVCIEVEERMTNIHTLNKAYPINMTLESFERKLPSEQFLRISRSCIVNIEAMQDIVLWFGNRYKIILTNGKEVVSSRERSKTLKKMLKF